MRRRRISWAELRGSGPADLWLISYSDMLTLLLAFFVLILSVAQVGKREFERLRAAINHRASAPSEDQLNRLAKAVDEWAKREHLSQQVATSLDHNGLRVQFANTLLFDSGKAMVNHSGERVLLRFIDMFRSLDPAYRIVVEGYSDDVPINNPQFRSNWALSSARAVEVLERFVDHGVAKDRMSVEAFADTRPVDAVPPPRMSATEQKDFIRSLNRRVIIRVY
jgi:chemotaxis protein MotB